MKADVVCACISKSSGERIDRINHQMHIHHGLATVGFHGMRRNRLANHGAKSQIRHVMVVHHVKMNPIRASGQNVFDLITQVGKIGGEDGRGNEVRAVHATIFSRQ